MLANSSADASVGAADASVGAADASVGATDDASDDDEWDEDALASQLEDALEPARPPEAAPLSAIIAGPDLLSLLPDDLLLRVLQQLPLGPLTSVAMRVCRRLRDASSREARERTVQRLLEALRAAVAPPAAEAAAASSSSPPPPPPPLPSQWHRPWPPPPAAEASSSSSSPPPPPPPSPPPDVARRLAAVARAIEAALAAGPSLRYPAGARRLAYNLRKNEALRQRLLSGELSAAALVALPAAQLASSTQLEEREAWRKKRLRECVRKDWREGGFVMDLFRCESCGAAEARIHRTIRAGRAAVDRAATYATCKCGNRWEV